MMEKILVDVAHLLRNAEYLNELVTEIHPSNRTLYKSQKREQHYL